MTTGTFPDERTARRQIDLAVGILIGAHGYSEEQAFAELASHARVDAVGLLPTARAVVELAQGRTSTSTAAAALLFGRAVTAA